jgi:photosystem II stability/assembly factor-like uncharacterized protein
MRVYRRRVILGLIAGAILVPAAGCSMGGVTPSSSGTAGAGVPTPATTAAPRGGPGGPPGGPVPAGFTAQDFTFVSNDHGWLLGTAPCSSPPCTSITRTTDGGRTWVGIPAPRADLEPNGQNGCDADQPCVRGIRFANDGVGYAYGSTALYLTTDGGAHWSRQSGQADAIEIVNGTALRVSHDMPGCPPGCGYQVSTAPVGATSWRTVTAPGAVTGNAAQLLRVGHRAFLTVYRNPAGGAGNAQATLLASGDDGQHWTTRPDPCGEPGGKEADSRQMAVAPDGSLTVLCQVREDQTVFVVTSTDGGATFGQHHPVPGGSGAGAVGAASARTLVVAAGGTLYRSADGGASWTSVAAAPVPSPGGPGGSGGSPVIGFQDGRTGRWVPGGRTVLTTTDGAASWTAHTFSG